MSVGSIAGKVALGSFGALGATTAAGVYVLKQPKTRQGEHHKNQIGTAFGLGTLAATPYLAKSAAKALPGLTGKVTTATGKGIEKAAGYVAAKIPVVTEKVAAKMPGIIDKISSTKVGAKVLDIVLKGAKKVANFVKNNKVLAKVPEKVLAAAEKFGKLSTQQKGKYALIAIGAGLLATAAVKLITGHFRKSGAIDYKYDEMYKDYQAMVATNPIMNARTGKPISFEDYCKHANDRYC